MIIDFLFVFSDLPNEYKSLLMKLCDIKYNDDNICFKDIPNANQPINLQNFVNIVSTILPKVRF